ncbi:hypothetical protein D3C72_2056530 [compost metagenome]
MQREVVLGHLDRFAIAQGLDVLHQQWPLERLRMVVILLTPDFRGKMGLVAIVVVLHHDRDHVGAERREHLLGYGGLATAASASDTNNKRLEGNIIHAE